MKNQTTRRSAFVISRLVAAFALFFLSAALIIFSFSTRLNRPEVAENSDKAESGERLERDMPTLGESSGSEARDLEKMEQFWSDRLTYPTGKFDPAWIRNAAEQHKQMQSSVPKGSFARLLNPVTPGPRLNALKGGSTDAKAGGKRTGPGPVPLALSTSGFTALGPTPEHMTGCSGCFNYTTTEGRINAIAVDPTTTTNGTIVAYAGSVGGGVWKTTNCCSASTSWTVTTDDPLIATTSIDTIAIDPNNHNTIYAGTGDLNFGSFSMGSQGILKSTNGGASWVTLGATVFGPSYPEASGNYPQYNAVGKVRVDPNNSNNIAAGTKTGLYISNDAGNTWTQCATNAFSTQRQDITGLELSNMGSGVTRVLVAIGTRGFPSAVQFDLGANGANGIYAATMPVSGCPSFSSIASNANGFVFGTQVTGSPYLTGANLNAGSGVPCNYPITGGNGTFCGNGATGGTTTNGGTVNNLSRIDIGVAPSNPNVIYAQVGSINWNNNTGSSTGCTNTNGCQLGAFVSTNGGTSWTFMAGSAGGALRSCGATGAANSTNSGDYPQNWYDQAVAVDPNDPTRVFFDTLAVWFATQSGTTWYDSSCAYSQTGLGMHADQHVLTFVPGSSDILLTGSDGGVDGAINASQTTLNTTRPNWFNMDTGLNTIEFYSGDISGNFANSSAPAAVGGAQDNGPSSAQFSGSPSGPVQWQMGLGGDGFSGLIDPMGTGSTQAQGTITLVTGGATAGQQFIVGTQTFTFQTAARSATGQVTLNSSTTTEGNNIVTAINADLAGQVTSARSGATVVVTAVTGGTVGNTIPFSNINSANFSMNGGGFLGGTTPGDNVGSLRYWEGNNSGGFSRCILNCTAPGAAWSSRQGGWTSDTQSFVLPVSMFHGGIAGGDDCQAAGVTTGCGHIIAGTTRVFETTTGATATNTWVVSNNPTTGNLTKQSLGNRSYINQVKYSPKFQSVAIAGTNDGNVQIGFNLGTGVAGAGNWVNVTGSNVVLPNRPINGIALDPSVAAANVPVGYAAVGGFNANSTIPGHVFQVTCQATCGSFVWADKTGNLPDIPIDSVIVNPVYPQQVFAGSDFGLYFTNDITQATPTWYRFNSGLPNVMIWDMSIDRGSTTLALWTRSRGAYVYPLPSSNITAPNLVSAVSRMTHGAAGTFDLPLSLSSRTVEPRSDGTGNYTVIFTFDQPVNNGQASSNTGTVSSTSFSGNTMTVSLTGVPDQQNVTVSANTVSGPGTATFVQGSALIGFLYGDVNGDAVVNVGDAAAVRSNAGVTLDNTNFQYDVNVDGMVNIGDTIVVRARSGDSLP